MRLVSQLEGYEKTGLLARHAATTAEIKRHIETANAWLTDAQKVQNSPETHFSVANSARHALLMAAIKMQGFRPTSGKGHRQILYQLLDTLLPAAAAAKKTLSNSHNTRNRAEYDGDDMDVTQGQTDDIVDAVKNVLQEVTHLFKRYQTAQAAPKKPSQ